MSYTLVLMVCGAQCAFPTVTVFGTYSSLAVCRAEKAIVAQELATPPLPAPVPDPSTTPAPAMPPFYWHLACARKT